MKRGQTVWIPQLRTYGKVRELNWDGSRIKSVEIIDPITKLPKIIEVMHLVVEAVGLIERIVTEIIGFFRSPKKKKKL